MGYLSCRAQSSIATCRSIAAVAPDNKRTKQQNVDAGDKSSGGVRRHIEQFSYSELETATGNFADAALLGRGSHGSVYKATLASGGHSVVAVKRSAASRNEVENEIEILSKIYSPRLVNLIGFSPNPKLLVVEFMPNGTLYDFLHNNPRPPEWRRRLRLALQTAKALQTLHSAKPPFIHRDVKSANVLIDRSFNARLGDFGLALRLDEVPFSCRSTPPAGTLGYLDPCYITPENLSTKIDVFSFGILLLEIMSGRKAIDVGYSPPSVVEWAVPLLRKGKVGAVFDPRIVAPKDSRVWRRMALLAVSCVRSNDERRPTMDEVVEELKVLSKAVRDSNKAWNGPCSAVATERTLLKSKPINEGKLVQEGTRVIGSKKPPLPAKILETKKLVKLEKDSSGITEVKLVEEESHVVGIKSPPLPLKTLGPLMSARRKELFLDERAKSGRNLMEFLARPEGEIIKFSTERVLRISSDRYSSGTVRPQNSDGRPHVRGVI